MKKTNLMPAKPAHRHIGTGLGNTEKINIFFQKLFGYYKGIVLLSALIVTVSG